MMARTTRRCSVRAKRQRRPNPHHKSPNRPPRYHQHCRNQPNLRPQVLPLVKHGNLTTEDQKVFYALIVYWEEKGRPEEPVNFSLRKLLRILKKAYGIKQRNSLIRSLLRIRMTGFTWENSYYDGSTGETIAELDT